MGDLARQISEPAAFCNLTPKGDLPVNTFGCMDHGVIIFFGPGARPPGQP